MIGCSKRDPCHADGCCRQVMSVCACCFWKFCLKHLYEYNVCTIVNPVRHQYVVKKLRLKQVRWKC